MTKLMLIKVRLALHRRVRKGIRTGTRYRKKHPTLILGSLTATLYLGVYLSKNVSTSQKNIFNIFLLLLQLLGLLLFDCKSLFLKMYRSCQHRSYAIFTNICSYVCPFTCYVQGERLSFRFGNLFLLLYLSVSNLLFDGH